MKKTNFLKFIICLTSLLLATALIAGCTPTEDIESTPDSNSASPSETPAETPEESNEESDKDTESAEDSESSKEPEATPTYSWTVGFGSTEIALPEDPKTPLYIAGYNQGVEISSVLDLQRANAVWLDAGDENGGILIISIDCVGLASEYVNKIRAGLSDLVNESGCAAINVISTHTHAGVDTFGLWGPAGVDGKNMEFMDNLVASAIDAAKKAYADRSGGNLFYSKVTTKDMLRDSRDPIVTDPNLYQLRFAPKDEAQNGIRIVMYGAHAESLRGANKKLSRDYPGVMSDILKEETGDDMIYLPGPIGGLVMTEELAYPFNALKNLELTGRKLADYLLSIGEDKETKIAASLSFSRVDLDVPVENTVFMLYKSLGILNNNIITAADGSVSVKSELNLISVGGKEGVLFGLIPGELFPELYSGTGLTSKDPTPLKKLSENAGFKKLLVINLANDELGYIVPPSDFIVHPTNPYFQRYEVNGEDHYEETNSVGKLCAEKIAEAFEKALSELEG